MGGACRRVGASASTGAARTGAAGRGTHEGLADRGSECPHDIVQHPWGGNGWGAPARGGSTDASWAAQKEGCEVNATNINNKTMTVWNALRAPGRPRGPGLLPRAPASSARSAVQRSRVFGPTRPAVREAVATSQDWDCEYSL